MGIQTDGLFGRGLFFGGFFSSFFGIGGVGFFLGMVVVMVSGGDVVQTADVVACVGVDMAVLGYDSGCGYEVAGRPERSST